MLPMVAVRQRLGVLLAGDATTLAPATAGNKIALVSAAFALSENLSIGQLTLAAGNGLDPILCATGAQETAIDPVTSEQVLTIVPAAGSGFRWVTSGTLAGPITIYGAALIDNLAANLLAAMTLPQPVAFHTAGYQLDIDPQTIQFVINPMF